MNSELDFEGWLPGEVRGNSLHLSQMLVTLLWSAFHQMGQP